jgi:hypothetical protein
MLPPIRNSWRYLMEPECAWGVVATIGRLPNLSSEMSYESFRGCTELRRRNLDSPVEYLRRWCQPQPLQRSTSYHSYAGPRPLRADDKLLRDGMELEV